MNPMYVFIFDLMLPILLDVHIFCPNEHFFCLEVSFLTWNRRHHRENITPKGFLGVSGKTQTQVTTRLFEVKTHQAESCDPLFSSDFQRHTAALGTISKLEESFVLCCGNGKRGLQETCTDAF